MISIRVQEEAFPLSYVLRLKEQRFIQRPTIHHMSIYPAYKVIILLGIAQWAPLQQEPLYQDMMPPFRGLDSPNYHMLFIALVAFLVPSDIRAWVHVCTPNNYTLANPVMPLLMGTLLLGFTHLLGANLRFPSPQAPWQPYQLQTYICLTPNLNTGH